MKGDMELGLAAKTVKVLFLFHNTDQSHLEVQPVYDTIICGLPFNQVLSSKLILKETTQKKCKLNF